MGKGSVPETYDREGPAGIPMFGKGKGDTCESEFLAYLGSSPEEGNVHFYVPLVGRLVPLPGVPPLRD